MGSCAAPSAKGDDKFITTDYLQQCPRNGDPFCKVYPQEPGIRVWVSAAMYVRQVDSGKKMPASGAGKQALTACTPSAKFYNFRQQAVCFRKSTEYVGYPRHSRNRSLSGR
ncbi:hypothetical protein B2J95_26260 (plasmid) [Enterobacter cloacae]|uniref:hypothetical protein n=1 Tax=Escherichia coli TaxID=562 RepID=UPI0009B349C2|nr:hypothetical protein B2J95_26260 [Enterobacter cloacae]